MKTSGDYALMHANGMSWKDVVEAIREEVLHQEHCGEGCTLPVTMTLSATDVVTTQGAHR